MKNLMTDPLRSATMRAVQSKNTRPELEVRRYIFSLGVRYRIHRKNLPGHPDIANERLKKAVFVNGCFWHGHDCKRGARLPKTNVQYWTDKIKRNRSRDAKNIAQLRLLGWSTLVIWECHLARCPDDVKRRIAKFFGVKI